MQDAQRGATYVGNDVCGSCHGSGRDESGTTRTTRAVARVNLADYRASAHGQGRVGCEQCHGPGSKHAVAPAEDNILSTPEAVTGDLCGACHAEIADQHEQSAHAQIASHGVEGGSPTCLPCHSEVYNLELIAEPYNDGADAGELMAKRNELDEDELHEFVEWTRTTANCANCHDPHAEHGNTTATGDTALLRRGLAIFDVSEVPAEGTPYLSDEGPATLDHLCAQCHTGGTGGTPDPTDQALTNSTSRPSVHHNIQFYMLMGRGGVESSNGDQPGDEGDDDTDADLAAHSFVADQCAGCHMANGNHTFQIVYADACTPCHTPTQAEQLADNRHAEVDERLEELEGRLGAWAQSQFGGRTSWEYTAYIAQGDPTPDQTAIPIEVKRARHNLHMVHEDMSGGIHNPSYTDELLDVVEHQLDMAGIGMTPAR